MYCCKVGEPITAYWNVLFAKASFVDYQEHHLQVNLTWGLEFLVGNLYTLVIHIIFNISLESTLFRVEEPRFSMNGPARLE